MADQERIDLTDEAVIILKHHGSYMQQNRDLQRTDKAAYAQSFQFMLRLKVPCGKLPADIYRVVDDIADKYGQGDIRATTRQAWQVCFPLGVRHGLRMDVPEPSLLQAGV